MMTFFSTSYSVNAVIIKLKYIFCTVSIDVVSASIINATDYFAVVIYCLELTAFICDWKFVSRDSL